MLRRSQKRLFHNQAIERSSSWRGGTIHHHRQLLSRASSASWRPSMRRNKTSSRAMHDSDGNVQLSERDEKLHQGIVSLSFCPPNPQKVRHLYEVGQRLRSHFPCDLTP